MHSLAFQVTWLLGAASAGDKAARAALSQVHPATVGDLNWDLEMLRQGVVNNNISDIETGLQRILGGFAKSQGETCTETIIKSMRLIQGEYATRAVAAAAALLPKDKLVEQLEAMLSVLKECEPKKKANHPNGFTAAAKNSNPQKVGLQ